VTGAPTATKSFTSSVEALLPTQTPAGWDIVAIATPQGWLVSSYNGSPVAMRRAGIVVGDPRGWWGAVVLAITGLVTNVVIGGRPTGPRNMAFANLNCNAGLGPFVGADAATGAAEAARLAPDQQSHRVGDHLGRASQRKPCPALGLAGGHPGRDAGIHAAQTCPAVTGTSAGIFQMRPSQGWGTYAQVTDPTYEVNKFFRRG